MKKVFLDKLSGKETKELAIKTLKTLNIEKGVTKYFEEIHKRSRQRVNEAWNDKADQLLKRIKKHLLLLQVKVIKQKLQNGRT